MRNFGEIFNMTSKSLGKEEEIHVKFMIFGQDFYQTYARITGSQGFAQIFLEPFSALNTGK